MVKIATSVLCAALLTGPALAVSSRQYRRDLEDTDSILVAREDLEALLSRELASDVEERSPLFLGMIFRTLAHLGHHAHDNNQQKRSNELEEREPIKFASVAHGVRVAAHYGQKALDVHDRLQNFRRYEVYERDYNPDGLLERDFFDELD